jgi:outer membrane protein OmpA-like peptidoglycan-associated protein
MRGIVYDKNTNKPLQAEFELVDLNSGEIVINSTSDKNTGSFFVCLPTTSEYGLNVDKNGYLFHSESFAIDDYYDASKPFEKNIYLKPIEKGQLIVLRNIYFETAKYELKQNSFAELNKLLKLLNQNKSMKIEIRGHTDNVGNNADNQLLSENRAKAVYDYLIENGIDKSRLNWKGFGDSMPIESNDTAEGRALNRRTEIKIIE